MTNEEAKEALRKVRMHFFQIGRFSDDTRREACEALDMAIEALKDVQNCVHCEHYTEVETDTGIQGECKTDTAHRGDTISRSRAIKDVSEWATDIIHPDRLVKGDAIYILESLPSIQADGDTISRQDVIELIKKSYYDLSDGEEDMWAMVHDVEQLPSAEDESRLYVKIYADDEPSVKAEKLYQICGETQNREVAEWIKEYFPSAEPKTGEWIPVSEKPKDEKKVYLVQLDSGSMCSCRWTNVDPIWTDLITDWHWNKMDTPAYTKVVAWMDLEPYREDGER